MRPHRIGTLLLIATAGLALPPAGVSAAAKPSCSAQKKALKQAKGDRKAGARKRYIACVEKALGAQVKSQLTDQRLVGRRGDGQYVDWLFCRSGKYRLETTGNGGRGISSGTRWVVTQAKGSATQWTAVIRETTNLRASGLSIGVARKGAQYSVGIDRGGDVTLPGPVTRTRDAAGCAAL